MTFALSILSAFITITLLTLSFWLFRRHSYKKMALTLCLTVSICLLEMATYYMYMETATASELESEYSNGYKDNLKDSYQGAVHILESLDFNHPDQHSADKAVKLLQGFGNKQIADELKDSCPDAAVLLTYAKAMNQVALYNGHMKNEDVSANQALLSEVQSIPDRYSGQLAKKIQPFRQLIMAMNHEALKNAELDQQNASKHEENMKKGQYGKVRPGESEECLVAAMGKPVRVNTTNGAGEETLKQYVFRHNSANIYVYTKDGIITEVSR